MSRLPVSLGCWQNGKCFDQSMHAREHKQLGKDIVPYLMHRIGLPRKDREVLRHRRQPCVSEIEAAVAGL